MLEAEIIAHCAPTLAGIKTANMFTYTPMNRNKLSMEIEEENRKLNCRGVFVEVLRTSEYKALVYVCLLYTSTSHFVIIWHGRMKK